MQKVSKILLKVAGWAMLALAVYLLITNGIAIIDAMKAFARSGSEEQAGNNFVYLVSLILGSILGIVFRAIAGPKGIRLKKSSFVWGIILVVFQVLGLIFKINGTWYILVIDVFYFVAACLVKFSPKSEAK